MTGKVLLIFKNGQNNGTEEIAFITPTCLTVYCPVAHTLHLIQNKINKIVSSFSTWSHWLLLQLEYMSLPYNDGCSRKKTTICKYDFVFQMLVSLGLYILQPLKLLEGYCNQLLGIVLEPVIVLRIYTLGTRLNLIYWFRMFYTESNKCHLYISPAC